MKHILSLTLVAILLLGMVGCGGEAAPATTVNNGPVPTIEVVEGQPIEQLEDVSVYIPVSGESQQLEGLPAYVFGSSPSASYKGAKESRYGQTTHIFNSTDAAAFITYLQALEKEGFQQYSNNIIEGTNLFATYTKGEESLYCYYISSKNRALIIHSPYQHLEVREQDNSYESVCTPLLTQVQLLCERWDGGMSYLIRLSDGRFVIVDSGYNEDDYYEAQQLYKRMEQQNVLPKITVAAWIITHPHRDHLGAASDFLRYYSPEQLDIQQMIFNFPTDEVLKTVEPGALDASDPSKMPAFLLALEEHWPEVPVTVCHTGQVYHFADAKFEILHTFEDFYPYDLIMQTQDPVNGSSVVFSMEVAGQKTMFLADSAVDCSKDLVKMWGSYLKSDIMQAAHHGLNGSSVELYKVIDPMVVTVPMCVGYVPKILTFKGSQWVWNNGSGNIREVMLSGWEERVLELPYTPAEDTPYFPAAASDPWAGLAGTYKTN